MEIRMGRKLWRSPVKSILTDGGANFPCKTFLTFPWYCQFFYTRLQAINESFAQPHKTHHFVIPCKRSATRNPVLSMASWIPAFAGKTIRVVVQSSQVVIKDSGNQLPASLHKCILIRFINCRILETTFSL